MGCVSSSFLEDDDGLGGAGPHLSHHIVSLTSTTYGLLTTLDQPHTQNNPFPPPPPPPPPPVRPPSRVTNVPRSEPEVINSWELMIGLDPTATHLPRTPLLFLQDIESRLVSSPPHASNAKPKPFSFPLPCPGKENSTSFLGPPSFFPSDQRRKATVLRPSNIGNMTTKPNRRSLEMFEEKCPPGGENSVIIYTTTLRGIRKTFEDCNAVRVALKGLGVQIKERDVSMDLGFREELRTLMKGSPNGATVPRVFVNGRYIGGAEQVLRIHEEGELGRLVEGLPTARAGEACDGCGGVRFLPCFRCSGSRKLVIVAEGGGGKGENVVRCPECNENGLVLCPICC